MGNRRAQIPISMERLAGLLELPEGMTPSHLALITSPDVVCLTVESEDLAVVEPGHAAPILRQHQEETRATDDDGTVWRRRVWMDDWKTA